MGLGGDLMWTAVIREMYKQHNRKICIKVSNKLIWENNPYVCFNKKHSMKLPKIPPESRDKNKWIVDKHTIITRCNDFGIFNPEIKCDLFFSTEEIDKINKILIKLPKKFIIVEPHSKTSWCNNKVYPFSKWQNIVNQLYKKIPIVQMSCQGKEILNNIINVSNEINNFREACLLIKYAFLFISCEGGLMHGSNAVNTKSVIIFSPLFDPRYTKYENVTDIWVKSDNHYNCFKVPECEECRQLMENHNENIIINKINSMI